MPNENNWESWSDSRTLMIRPLENRPMAYEYLVDATPLPEWTYLHHGVIFLNDYLKDIRGKNALTEILKSFDYNSIQDFLEQNKPADMPVPQNLEDSTCPEYFRQLAVSIIIESVDVNGRNPLAIRYETGDAAIRKNRLIAIGIDANN